jgi:hypothetical protein
MQAFNKALISTNSGSLKQGFFRDFVTYPVLNTGIGPDITFTRATSATFFDINGVLKTTSINTPRFEYDFPRANLVYNSSLCGVSMPYYIPYMILGINSVNPATGSQYPGKINNFDINIVNTGTENGLPYVDICLSGGPRGSQIYAELMYFQYNPNDPTGQQFIKEGVNPGSVYTISAYMKLLSGSVPTGATFGFLGNGNNYQCCGPFGSSTFRTGSKWVDLTDQLQRFSYPRWLDITNSTAYKTASAMTNLRVGLYILGIPSDYVFPEPFCVRVAGIQVEPGYEATDFIPTNGGPVYISSPKGLLIEQRSTNLLSFSNTFNNWSPCNLNETLSATNLSPELSANGWSIYESTGTGLHSLSSTFTLTNTTTGSYTFSSFFKFLPTSAGSASQNPYPISAGRRYAFLSFEGDAFNNEQTVIFALSGKGETYSLSGNSTSSINYVGNGWYRCSITGNALNATTDAVRLGPADSLFSNQYTGSTSNGLFVYGAQLENTLSPTSYIPTSNSTVIRSGDDLIVYPISSFYNQEGGSIYAEGATKTSEALPCLVTFDDTTTSNRVQIRRNESTNCSFFNVISGKSGTNIKFGPPFPPSLQMSISYPPSGAQYGYTWTGWNNGTDIRKVAAFYNNNEQFATQNGEPLTIYNKLTSVGCPPYAPVTPGGDGDLGLPDLLTRMVLGRGPSNSGYLNGYLREVRYIQYRLNETLLKKITE